MAMIRATKGSAGLTAPPPQKYGFYGFRAKNSTLVAKSMQKPHRNHDLSQLKVLFILNFGAHGLKMAHVHFQG